MKVYFNRDNLENRAKTEIKDEESNVLYWGIYDFAFKHRTRIFDTNNTELVYVQKDISKDYCLINICDGEDQSLGYIKDDKLYPEGWKIDGNKVDGVMSIEDEYMLIEDEKNLLKCITILFALIEKER